MTQQIIDFKIFSLNCYDKSGRKSSNFFSKRFELDQIMIRFSKGLLYFQESFVQWKPLNVITNNLNIWLLWSNLPRWACPKSLFNVGVKYIKSMIVIIPLILSVFLCPKVITWWGLELSANVETWKNMQVFYPNLIKPYLIKPNPN